MIKGYKDIAIIWGRKTKYLALMLNDALLEYQKQGYPISPKMCYDKTLDRAEGGDILTRIQTTFKNAVYAFVLLGEEEIAFDSDIMSKIDELFSNGKKEITKSDFIQFFSKHKIRTTQNVIMECGHFFHAIGTDNISFITNFEPNKIIGGEYELPTDFPTVHFTKIIGNVADDFERMEPAIKRCVETAIVKLRINAEKNPIYNEQYDLDYTELFTEKEAHQLEAIKDRQKQLIAIDEKWSEELNSLTRNSERLIYILERIVFTSYFDVSYSWLTNGLALITNTNGNELSENEMSILTLIHLVREYISLRNNFSIDNQDYTHLGYLKIAKQLSQIKEQLKNVSVNIVIRVVLNDYIGLAYRASWEGANVDNKDSEWLVQSALALHDCINLTSKNNPSAKAHSLWHGYSYFNLARTNRYISKLSSIENISLKEKINQGLKLLGISIIIKEELFDWKLNMEIACNRRKEWSNSFTVKGFPTELEIALRLEYIYAETHRYELLKCYPKEKIEKLYDNFNEIISRSSSSISLIARLHYTFEKFRKFTDNGDL